MEGWVSGLTLVFFERFVNGSDQANIVEAMEMGASTLLVDEVRIDNSLCAYTGRRNKARVKEWMNE
jgi:hypothetical protein